jgi:hypothetical protein
MHSAAPATNVHAAPAANVHAPAAPATNVHASAAPAAAELRPGGGCREHG